MMGIMPDDQIPPGHPFITSPPNRQQIEGARELCVAMLDKMHALFWKSNDIAFRYEFWHADDEERKKPVHDRERMELLELLPSWATETLQAIAEINGLEKEAEQIVRPWGFFFDRFSGEVLSIGSKSYSNALLAILGVIRDLIHQMDHARDRIEAYNLRLPVCESTAAALAKGARYIWDARISLIGDDFRGGISYLQAHLGNQMAKAAEVVDRDNSEPPQAVLSEEEATIIKALRDSGRRMKQMELLAAAGLEAHGNYKFLVAQMLRRGLLDHGPGRRGTGFGLPEWNDMPG